jgi:hypothetical protein
VYEHAAHYLRDRAYAARFGIVARHSSMLGTSDVQKTIAKISVAARERGRFSKWMKGHFFLRVHMSLILAGTVAAGTVATKLLLTVHLNRLWIRYAIAVLFAYGAFLLLVRCWLYYVGFRAQRQRRFNALDVPADFANSLCDLGGNWGSSVADVSGDAVQSGGGSFGGGGSSGSWGVDDNAVSVVSPSGGGGGGGGGGGWGIDLGLDLDDSLFLVVIAALIAAVLVGIYLIYAAPAILSEAAFEAVLGAALLKKAKEAGSGNWVGSVVKATIIPFLLVASLSTVVGWYAQVRCPGATRLHDALFCASRH